MTKLVIKSFQDRVLPWLHACFGPEISADKIERNHRFLEESLEVVQANGCTRSEAHQLVDYVFDRPVGELNQEVGGAMVTLAALCLASDVDMHRAGETELNRIWTMVEKIRAKQAAKPKHSPLPAASQTKFKMVCRTCGSEEVLADAYARWNVEEQDWELANTFDKGAYCEGACDGETRIEEIKITDTEDVPQGGSVEEPDIADPSDTGSSNPS